MRSEIYILEKVFKFKQLVETNEEFNESFWIEFENFFEVIEKEYFQLIRTISDGYVWHKNSKNFGFLKKLCISYFIYIYDFTKYGMVFMSSMLIFTISSSVVEKEPLGESETFTMIFTLFIMFVILWVVYTIIYKDVARHRENKFEDKKFSVKNLYS
ncbi:hypothetical protein [Salipaludibacillus agaradhaerens]|uniref:hypothetical protein n=1 Tax=Salipaludibacillus agaradhaerens TaxID=76935 RepID=UPI000997F817|nr:hypothetical protein [Salipaludibacillus agaradhaerens]